jgi:hypothetical protein
LLDGWWSGVGDVGWKPLSNEGEHPVSEFLKMSVAIWIVFFVGTAVPAKYMSGDPWREVVPYGAGAAAFIVGMLWLMGALFVWVSP